MLIRNDQYSVHLYRILEGFGNAASAGNITNKIKGLSNKKIITRANCSFTNNQTIDFTIVPSWNGRVGRNES